MITPYDLAGILGAAIAILAYFATQKNWLTAQDWRFPAANLLAAILILASLVADWNLASFIIEAFWLAISIYGVSKSLFHQRGR
jgi:hypothetical protein